APGTARKRGHGSRSGVRGGGTVRSRPTGAACASAGGRGLTVAEAPRPLRLAVGQRAAFSKTIAEADIRTFAAVTGDRNPLHLDETFAGRSRFGRPIAHGILVAGVISAALGMVLPGPGAIYLSQTLKFLRPVYPGDTVTA